MCLSTITAPRAVHEQRCSETKCLAHSVWQNALLSQDYKCNRLKHVIQVASCSYKNLFLLLVLSNLGCSRFDLNLEFGRFDLNHDNSESSSK